MQQHQSASVLAPYGSLAFLSMAAKVGTKVISPTRSGAVTGQRKVVRRNASV